jgi:hypothetical protein
MVHIIPSGLRFSGRRPSFGNPEFGRCNERCLIGGSNIAADVLPPYMPGIWRRISSGGASRSYNAVWYRDPLPFGPICTGELGIGFGIGARASIGADFSRTFPRCGHHRPATNGAMT